MNILIIGGTQFVGRAITSAALAQNHTVTLFNRGKTSPDLFPKAEQIIGDRDGGLDKLEGRRWDAVIDTCGYFPRVVRQSAELLRDACQLYLFISTISVYDSFAQPGLDENSPLAPTDNVDTEEITEKSYGPLKVQCEEIIGDTFGSRALIIRPGLIVGPYDPTDRFSYWPHRVFAGGEFLVPTPEERAVQFIDVRDLAEWSLRMILDGKRGIYNATGPDYELTLGEFIEKCRETANPEAKPVWVNPEFLEGNDVEVWKDFPLVHWKEDYQGLMKVNCSKAINAGLAFRPLKTTIKDTLKWMAGRSLSYEWKAGLDPEREQELIRLWKKKSSTPS